MSKEAMQKNPVPAAWDEGYRQGVKDERTSEANIGIAGFGAKVEPARQNPYGTTPAHRTWVGLTDDELEELEVSSVDRKWGHLDASLLSRSIEAKLKEKNT